MVSTLSLAQAGNGWTEVASEPSAPRGVGVLAFTGVLIGAAVLPFVYAFVAFQSQWAEALNPPVLRHIGFNCFANGVVVLSSLRLKGRLDRKLANVLWRVIVVHGALAFMTLITRHFYSISMMLTGLVCSTLLGAGAMYGQHLRATVRAAVLGPDHPAVAATGVAWEPITDPEASLRRFDLVLTTFSGEASPETSRIITRALLAGKRVRHVSEYLEELRGMVAIEHFSLDHLPEGGAASYRARKRVFDILTVLVTAPITLPILGLAALAVRLTMGRPVLFTQARIGQGGRAFTIYKLRTMRPEADRQRVVATIRGDTRITPLGRWLRRYRIDELPQLWNVLIGDMSLVGPRPEASTLAEAYIRDEPAFVFRHLVRPGITGWAQVRAGYAADLAETRVKLAYDLFYLKNFSFSLDLQIAMRTVWTIASGGGAR